MGTAFARLFIRWQAAPLSIVPFSEACEHQGEIIEVFGSSIRAYGGADCDAATREMLDWYARTQCEAISDIAQLIATKTTGFWIARYEDSHALSSADFTVPEQYPSVYIASTQPSDRQRTNLWAVWALGVCRDVWKCSGCACATKSGEKA